MAFATSDLTSLVQFNATDFLDVTFKFYVLTAAHCE